MAVEVKSVDEFGQILKDFGNGLVVVHFAATWAPHCKQMADVIGELVKDNVHVKFLQIEAEDLVSLSEKFKIASVPTILFFKNEKEIDRLEGANAPELTKKVTHHASTFVPPTTSTEVKQESLDQKLKRLINSSPNMLFMKGTPEQPRCGFSKQVLQILSGYKFGTFDILTDDEVRQGLKTYSNWPTFPQFYVNGELVGGLDILKELSESSELETMLAEAKVEDLNSRLHKLVNSAPVLVVMKGSQQEPKCGFSRQLCQLLDSYPSVKFSTFDILKDEEVRQGIKKFSNWPTFPQIYVNGELIGGLDIVKELHESGELGSVLSP
ncbi:glutaredoxin-3-like [Dendronephthya gigantea]|uniref:glutaredoxin-3-like n=1 Tax=Dendronephthya gigantea TaxID=151771 RepID=UPI00106AE481|nr:glutaredoxin-3-like [Dendronephthya gigantea]